jgi:hypothetical protein
MKRVRSIFVPVVALAMLVSGLGTLVNATDAGAARNRTVEVTPQYKRIIKPADPLNPPSTPPAILPTVTCVRRIDRQKETVFGYVHNGIGSYDAPINTPSVANYFMVGRDTVSDLGQLDQFLPGDHPSRFAVRTARPARWVLDVPGLGSETLGRAFAAPYWRVTIKARRSDCGTEVPVHFAVMRGGVTADGRAVDIERLHIVPDRITGYSLDFAPLAFSTHQLSCSAGGTRDLPRLEYAYAEGTINGRSFDNLVPLPGAQVLGSQVLNGIVFTRTEVSTREVADVDVDTNVKVLVDAYARCRFGATTVEAADAHWGGDNNRLYSTFRLLAPDFDAIAKSVNEPGGGVRFR